MALIDNSFRPVWMLGACATLASVLAGACAKSDESANVGHGSPNATGCEPEIESIRSTIFRPRCATAGCHVGPDPASSLDLDEPGVAERLVGLPATECGGKILVVPARPDESYLVEKLAAAKPTCGARMPIGGAALDEDETACIRQWIESLPLGEGGEGGTPSDDGGPGVPACAGGLTACGDRCVDLATDPKSCGECGVVCPVACSSGACVTSCPPNTTSCEGACVDTSTSSTHCGSCGNACEAGKVCTEQSCTCGAAASFRTIQDTILTPSCASQQCHGGAQPKAGLDLRAGASHRELVGAASSSCRNASLVVRGSVESSYLMNKLTGVGMCAGSQMPKAGTSLPAPQLDLVRRWICNGALDN